VLAVFAMGRADCHHVSFEVQDSEAHVWRDPSGYRFETYSDTDLCDASQPAELHDVKDAQMDLWSNETPDRYFQ
jgi:hypothetical protein